MATMLLGGIWHGANYTFIVWGAIHSAALVLEHLLGRKQVKTYPRQMSFNTFFGWTYTFLVVFIAWVFFRAADMHQAIQIVAAMANPASFSLRSLSVEIKQIMFLVAALILIQIPIEKILASLRRERLSPHIAVGIAFWAMVASVILGAPVTVPFIYFQF